MATLRSSRLSSEDSRSSTRRQITARWKQLHSAVMSAAAERDEDPSVPGVELGRFELLDWLGGGGMGVVFHARDTKLGREVALKLWKLPGEEAEAAVLHEAQCLAKLSHPNVVAFYETGKVGNDVFLTMEVVQGKDGREWLCYPTNWREVVDFYLAAGRGLAAAHAVGLEHSDFKPENVLIGKDRRVRVADFGVARALRDHVSLEDDTLSAEESGGLGTLCYMAPERLHGRRGDALADQFSYCVTLWECLYGARPFAGKTPAALLESIEAGDRNTRHAVFGIPWRLRQVVERGLSVRPEDRWPDMPALLGEITRRRWQRQRRTRRLGLAAVGVGFAVGGSAMTAAVIAYRAPVSVEEPTAPSTTEASDELASPEHTPIDDAVFANMVVDVVTRIEADDLDGAYERWFAVKETAWEAEMTIEWQSLEIAHVLADKARVLEHTAPVRATDAASYACLVASYAQPFFLADGGRVSEIAEILESCTRLNSPANRLLADHAHLSNSAAAVVCSCSDSLGQEACLMTRTMVGPPEHACLSRTLWGNESLDGKADPVVGQYLECVVPVLEAHHTCLNAADCDPSLIGRCDAEQQRGVTACPQLPDATLESFTNCTK